VQSGNQFWPLFVRSSPPGCRFYCWLNIYTIYTSTFVLFKIENNFPWLREEQCKATNKGPSDTSTEIVIHIRMTGWLDGSMAARLLNGCYQRIYVYAAKIYTYLSLAESLLNNQTITASGKQHSRRLPLVCTALHFYLLPHVPQKGFNSLKGLELTE